MTHLTNRDPNFSQARLSPQNKRRIVPYPPPKLRNGENEPHYNILITCIPMKTKITILRRVTLSLALAIAAMEPITTIAQTPNRDRLFAPALVPSNYGIGIGHVPFAWRINNYNAYDVEVSLRVFVQNLNTGAQGTQAVKRSVSKGQGIDIPEIFESRRSHGRGEVSYGGTGESYRVMSVELTNVQNYYPHGY